MRTISVTKPVITIWAVLLAPLGAAGQVPTSPSGRIPAIEGLRNVVQPPSGTLPNGWRPLFFDNDFSFLNAPDHPRFFGEETKDVPIDFLERFHPLKPSRISFGGELRHRAMNETDRLRPGGPARSSYELWRWRNYLDFYMSDEFRLYVEMIDASSVGEELAPLGIDVNRWDILNGFFDLKVAERDDRPVYLRAGRQELLYGAQRLVSPLDWSNTRRNFEGFKLFSPGETWDIDAFVTRPVNAATGNGPPSRFDNERDRADASRTFSGIYAVHHGFQDQRFDFYWLYLREQEHAANLKDGSRQTVGLRWAGAVPPNARLGLPGSLWSYDFEGAYQFGHDNGLDVRAGFFTGQIAHTWVQVPWKPKVTALYYWGSGDRDPNDDEDNTFSVLFPLGHAYWGIIDNLSGQNLKDYSVQFAMSPTPKLSLASAMHWFDLARNTDVLYNVAGAPLGTPGTGTDLGEELDLIARYQFSPSFSIEAGQSWFWYGTFINNNLPRDTATQFYLQTTLRY